MEQSRRFAFIDDSGDAGFDSSKGTSRHFVVAAVVIPEEKMAAAEEKVDDIRQRYFRSGELLSSKIGANDDLRMAVLRDLLKIDFHALVGVTDKPRFRRLASTENTTTPVGLISRNVHHDLQRIFPSLHIVADSEGDENFMPGFADYVARKIPRSLFDNFDVEFKDSRTHSLLQAADFIAGTVRQQYRRRKAGPNFVHALLPKVTLHEWPNRIEKGSADSIPNNPAFDPKFALKARKLAQGYIDSHFNDNASEVLDRVSFLEFLQSRIKYGNPTSYVTTYEILRHLNAFRDEPCTRHYLRSSVVAPLRDLGILIASNTHGYKIPVTAEELYEFINQSLTILNPMLNRLEKCRQQVSLVTDDQLDLFDRGEYQLLRRLLNVYAG